MITQIDHRARRGVPCECGQHERRGVVRVQVQLAYQRVALHDQYDQVGQTYERDSAEQSVPGRRAPLAPQPLRCAWKPPVAAVGWERTPTRRFPARYLGGDLRSPRSQLTAGCPGRESEAFVPMHAHDSWVPVGS